VPGDDVIGAIARGIKRNDKRNSLSVGVLASGYGSNLQALIDRQKSEPKYFSINLVMANIPNAYAITRAQQASLICALIDDKECKERSFFESQALKLLVTHKINLLVLAGFTRILSARFLALFSYPIINIHPSLLPKYCGLHAIKKAFIAREAVTGCTVHLVDEGLDTGPIIAQSSCPIFDWDSLADVTERVHRLEHALLPSVVEAIAKRLF
jgi:phosphoribosylglycinamide formyltransferase-1